MVDLWWVCNRFVVVCGGLQWVCSGFLMGLQWIFCGQSPPSLGFYYFLFFAKWFRCGGWWIFMGVAGGIGG